MVTDRLGLGHIRLQPRIIALQPTLQPKLHTRLTLRIPNPALTPKLNA